MKLTVDGRPVETLAITLTDADGASSTHAVSPDALVRALAGELGLSMREVAIAFEASGRARCGRMPEPVPQDLLDTMGDLLTTAEAARVLNVSPHTVTRLCESGRLRAVRVASMWRIPKVRLREYIGT